jgi:antitoxin component of MazEF toxin-antitoxin module
MQRLSFYPNSQNMRKWGNATAFLLPKFMKHAKMGQCSGFPFTQIHETCEKVAMQRLSFYPNPQNMRKWGNATVFLLPKSMKHAKMGQCSGFPFTQIHETYENGAMQRLSFYPNSRNMRKWGNATVFLLPKSMKHAKMGQCNGFPFTQIAKNTPAHQICGGVCNILSL